MSRRLVLLHLRARRVPAVLAGLAVTALVTWRLGELLAHAHGEADPDARLPLTVIAPLVAATIIGPALGGADDELEESARTRWTLLRLGPVVGLVLAATALLAATGLWQPAHAGAHALARNTLGLATLAAALTGGWLAWVPAFAYAVTLYAGQPADLTAGSATWAWPLQPTSVRAALLVALALAGLGAAVHARYGARRRQVPGR